MNKKIKVIELFNMIANGNIPKMIEYNCQRYQWYVDEYRRLEDDRRLTDLWIIEQILNDEVEILEDEEEIDIQNIEELQTYSDSTVYDYNDIDRNRKVLNMLVKAVKKLDKNKVDYIQPYKED